MTDSSRRILVSIAVLSLVGLAACGKEGGKERTAPPATAAQAKELISAQARDEVAPKSSPDEPPPPSRTLALPLKLARHTDDLDAMIDRKSTRLNSSHA